jgi:CMP-N-acetylneuraminic acid synthetase
VVDFCGRPIIAYAIAAAHEAKIFDQVLVSTEDVEIAQIAACNGTQVDHRPKQLATDASSVNQVCLELLDRLERNGTKFDTLTVLYATAPLRTADDVRATFALIRPGDCDFAIAATEFAQPVHQALRADLGGTAVAVFPELVRQRSDTVGRFVAGNGSTYCATVSAFRREKSFYGTPLKIHLMPRPRSIDIDTADDLALALYYYRSARAADAC